MECLAQQHLNRAELDSDSLAEGTVLKKYIHNQNKELFAKFHILASAVLIFVMRA